MGKKGLKEAAVEPGIYVGEIPAINGDSQKYALFVTLGYTAQVTLPLGLEDLVGALRDARRSAPDLSVKNGFPHPIVYDSQLVRPVNDFIYGIWE